MKRPLTLSSLIHDSGWTADEFSEERNKRLKIGTPLCP